MYIYICHQILNCNFNLCSMDLHQYVQDKLINLRWAIKFRISFPIEQWKFFKRNWFYVVWWIFFWTASMQWCRELVSPLLRKTHATRGLSERGQIGGRNGRGSETQAWRCASPAQHRRSIRSGNLSIVTAVNAA